MKALNMLQPIKVMGRDEATVTLYSAVKQTEMQPA